MPTAEIQPLSPGLWIWQDYDPQIKTELFSTALRAQSGLYLVDPIPLPDAEITKLSASGPIGGIFVTNANHQRAAPEYSERLSVPLFAHGDAFGGSKPTHFQSLAGDAAIKSDLEAIEIEGAAPGEIALYHAANGGTLIFGDAVINFEPYGFTFLPKKYCRNEKQMRSSLRQLLEKPDERMLFAHGTPILSGATSRLRQLLESQ